MVSQTEENYLKALFHLTYDQGHKAEAGTNEVAEFLEVKPASANDMLKKLKDKGYVWFEKYGKITLTKDGKAIAVEIVRKHRLWETFLYEKMNFSWDEIHEVAEQLEHIKSQKLIEQLEILLDYPQVDPHGDPIPNAKGKMKKINHKRLSEVCVGNVCKLINVKDDSVAFLQYVANLGLSLNSKIKILSRQEFDGSMEIEVNRKRITVSQKFGNNLFVV